MTARSRAAIQSSPPVGAEDTTVAAASTVWTEDPGRTCSKAGRMRTISTVARVLTSGKSSRLYKRLVYTDQIATDVAAYQGSSEIGSTFAILLASVLIALAIGATLSAMRRSMSSQAAWSSRAVGPRV